MLRRELLVQPHGERQPTAHPNHSTQTRPILQQESDERRRTALAEPSEDDFRGAARDSDDLLAQKAGRASSVMEDKCEFVW